MGGSKSKMVIMFVMLLIIFKSGWSEGCLDHERFALLRLKHFFNGNLYDWVDDAGATDCCLWERVDCSNTTGRVIKLDLAFIRNRYLGADGYLNASCLLPFNNLKFDSLRNLEELEIGGNKIDKFVVSKGLRKLRYLSLSEFDSFNNLEVLNMRYNEIDNLVVPQGLCSLVHLQELYIDNNDLRGSLPWCLANMTSLRILDVFANQLTGSISSSPLVHLTSIEELYLSNNHLRIPISLEPLFNHSRLKIFRTYNNEINAEIIESHSLTAPNFQLQSLSMSSLHGDGVTFPKFLYHQHDLEDVDLSHIKMNGEFPNWLLENNTKLETLFLVNDSLAGPFWLPIHSYKRLRLLDISNNNFQGCIPVEIGDILPSLLSFNISMNALCGSIPSSFGKMNFLRFLDLSNNQLTGESPSTWPSVAST
ncbi:hypothetical protein WN943_023056 [Citrus x changshan-huyou]